MSVAIENVTHARVWSTTIVNANSKNETRQIDRRRQAENSYGKK